MVPPTFLDTDEGTSVISIPLDTVIYYVTGYADCDTIYDTITVNAYTVEGIADAGPDLYFVREIPFILQVVAVIPTCGNRLPIWKILPTRILV